MRSGVERSAGDAGTSLGELAALFLRLGATAFGGPAAHIAMMRDEVVRRRGVADARTFLDLLGAANLIPGPNSTEWRSHRCAAARCGRRSWSRARLHPSGVLLSRSSPGLTFASGAARGHVDPGRA